MIRCHEVSFGFGGADRRRILDSVSLTIEDGEWVAIAGGNGSGKTTLCRLIAGLLSPSSGSVEVDGVDPALSGRPDSRSGPNGDGSRAPSVGIAFQNPDSQFVTSTVTREILFGMENIGVSPDELESRTAEASRIFRLERYLGRNPHTISAGEKQRLLLACLWSMSPRHLVLDEPFSFLDREGRAAFLETLRGSFRSEGKTVVWSTIDREEVALADRVIFIDAGRIAFDGAAEGMADALAGHVLGDTLVHGARSEGPIRGASKRDSTVRSRNLIEIRDASFSPSGGDFVLKVPFFALPPGERLGVRGPSGSGKTTFLLGCGGLLAPRNGTVTILGKRCSSRRDFPAGRIAYLFQTPEEGFFAPTVREEVGLAHRSLVGRAGEETAVTEALEEVGLDPRRFLERNPFHLSQGEKRLVALASVLVLDAEAFLLDEPTIFLDASSRRALRRALERIESRGASVMIASHDEAFLESYAERIVTVDGGSLAGAPGS